MKKIVKTLVALSLMTMVFTGCSLVEEVGPTHVNVVDANVIIEKMDNDETFAFIIGDAKCPACMAYLEDLKEFEKKESVILDYIDLDALNDSQIKDAQRLVLEYLNEDFEATPTTYFVVDGEVKESEIGVIEYEVLKEMYDKILQ